MNSKKLILGAALFVAAFLAGLGVCPALPASRVAPDRIRVIAEPGLLGALGPLLQEYSSRETGARPELEPASPSKAQPRPDYDVGLFYTPHGHADTPLFYDHRVIAAGFLDEAEDITLEHALEAAGDWEDIAAAGKGYAVTTWSALNPEMKPLAVNGVRPTPQHIVMGAYPLSRPVYLWTFHRPGRPWSSLLDRYLRPNRAAVERFVTWLRGEEARSIFYAFEPHASLVAVGDIMLARGVGKRISEHGTGYPFVRTRHIIRNADIAFGNLESPIGSKGRPIPGKGIWFRAAPATVECLVDGGLDVVTVANNHILDYDSENFLETLELLQGARIRHVGGGRNLEEALSPVIVEANGIRVAFLGYSDFADIFWDYGYPRRFAATDTLPGVAPLKLELVRKGIEYARQRADLVVVAYHWGEEYQNLPTPRQVKMGRATVDAGADVVLGFHPHAIQSVELYKGGIIAYSLGNFVMDQTKPVTRESMILELTITRRGVKTARVIPAMIDAGQPRPLEGSERSGLLSKIRDISLQIPR